MSCLKKIWQKWVRVCLAINLFFQRVFTKWADIVCKNPWKIIIAGTVVALALMTGFLRFRELKHTERLYFPESSHTKDDLARAEKSFPQKIKPDEWILAMGDKKQSILNTRALQFAFDVHKHIWETTDLEQSCYKTKIQGTQCLILSVLELFKYNASLMATDDVIQTTIANTYLNDKLIMENGRPGRINFPNIFGKFSATGVNNNKNKNNLTSSSTSTGMELFASSIRFMYFMKFPEDDSTFDPLTKEQKKVIDYLLTKRDEARANGMEIFIRLSRSVDDGIADSTNRDIMLIVISIFLMFVFTLLILVRFRDHVTGHAVIGIVGVGCCIFGIGSGFGLVLLSGNYFVGFVGTLPFLVLGVGIDDMFIILDALDDLPSNITGNERLKKAVGKVGASITMTTLTDIVAFAISASSDFPAIRIFCLYAMTSILLTYLLVITVFLAVTSLDVKRIEANRWDFLCCVKQKSASVPWKKSSSTLSRKIMGGYAQVLMLTPVRLLVVVLCCGLIAGGVYGTFHVEEDFKSDSVVRDDAYVIKYEHYLNDNYPMGFDVYIINDDVTFDYTNHAQQQNFMRLDLLCQRNPFMQNKTINWLSAFMSSPYFTSTSVVGGGSGGNYPNQFYMELRAFLQENPLYYADLVFDDTTGRIRYSRVQCEDKDVHDWKFRANGMTYIRKAIEAESDRLPHAFAITLDFFYRDMIVFAASETRKNLIFSAAAILIITTPYLVHPVVILLVLGGFVALVFELFGLMAAWGVALNSISMITLVMAIGFVVDYSAHVAHAYLQSNRETPEERMVETLSTVGASVLMGGFTTLLGILTLAFGKSEVFRIFFKMFFGIVGLGLINGLVFLPVLLTIFVRGKVDINHKPNGEEEDNEQNNRGHTDKSVVKSNPHAT